ncbi:MAG: hypothetical protein OEU26_35560 [Candidatus Tectomicrobia bacterium]|nr:hypothetical protein [Candidatus Tectomicrobia bacterium]
MKKTEVYSWRVSPELKTALEDAARVEGMSVALLLDRIVTAWLAGASADGDEEDVQQRLYIAAERAIGTIHGGDPRRAEHARNRSRTKTFRPPSWRRLSSPQ